MGFFKKIFGGSDASAPAAVNVSTLPQTIHAPLSGNAIPMEKIPDDVFSGGALGPGCGIEPDGDTVYAPFDGTVTLVADTLHAIGLAGNDGIEVLIHVGIDTVDMNGKGFKALIKSGAEVKAGTPLLSFDRAVIKAAGHPDVTAVIVTNGDDYPELSLEASGHVEVGAPLLKY